MTKPQRTSEGRAVLPLALFMVTYLAGAELGHALSFPGDFASFWPPSGIYLAALLIAPRRLWGALVVTALGATLISDVGLHDQPLWVSLSFFIANTLEAGVAAWLLQLLCGPKFSLARLRDVLLLAGVSAVGTTAMAACWGALTVHLAYGTPFWETWQRWWFATLVGVLVVAPLILSTTDPLLSRKLHLFRRLEEFTAWSLLTVVALVLFGCWQVPASYAVIPVMLWIALRFTVRGVAVGSFLLTLTAVWGTVQGNGPFVENISLQVQPLLVQGFAAVTAISFLILASILEERRRAQESILARDEFSQDLFQNMNDLAHSIAPDGRILHVNAAWKRTLGYHDDDLAGLSLAQVVHPDDRAYMIDILGRVVSGQTIDCIELRFVTKNGQVIHVEGSSSCRYRNGQPIGTRSLYRDVTQRKLAEKQASEYQSQLEEVNSRLRSLSITDELTKLYNRRFFQQKLQEEFDRAGRYGMPLSLVLIDVDHFKRYNDSYGHLAGDSALCNVARLLTDNARGSDVVARFGGEEFAILLPITDLEGGVCLAERFREAVEIGPWVGPGVTVSVGVATTCGDVANVSDLIRQADDALYVSKQKGRNCVTAAEPIYSFDDADVEKTLAES